MPLRGQVWLVDLDPTKGHKQAKTRPCVVISNDQLNNKMGLSIIAPMTGTPHFLRSGKLSPAMIEVLPPEGGILKPSYSIAYQVRTVSHSRFAKKLGTLTLETLEKIVFSVHNIIEA